MEPSTPPRSSRSRDFLTTPKTPRFGSFGDLTEKPRKLQFSQSTHGGKDDGCSAEELTTSSVNTHTPRHRRKRSLNVLATPRQTPRKRRERETPQRPHSQEIRLDTDLITKLREPEVVPIQRPPEPETQQQVAEQPHPHQDSPPPNVPGMWYVFRGKKIFRPLPAGEKPIEPVTLFKDEINQQQNQRKLKAGDLFMEEREDSDSEADTDVEWDSV